MHKVLITKELSNRDEATAVDYGLDVVEQPFIKIIFEYDAVEVPPAEAWIVTSANASKYIDAHYEEFVNKPKVIYAIGESTAQPLQNLPINIKMPSYGLADNVKDLVLKDDIQSAVFFSGNLRGDVIPSLAEEIDLVERVVYKTELLDIPLNMDEFEGVAFFSPSGVKAFAQSNKITNQKVVAIGTTTKQAVRDILGVEAGIPATTKVEDVLFALKEDIKNK